MELTVRQLAFLEHEMTEIKNDRNRPSEDRSHASSVLGRIEEVIEHEKEENAEGTVEAEATELFS